MNPTHGRGHKPRVTTPAQHDPAFRTEEQMRADLEGRATDTATLPAPVAPPRPGGTEDAPGLLRGDGTVVPFRGGAPPVGAPKSREQLADEEADLARRQEAERLAAARREEMGRSTRAANAIKQFCGTENSRGEMWSGPLWAVINSIVSERDPFAGADAEQEARRRADDLFAAALAEWRAGPPYLELQKARGQYETIRKLDAAANAQAEAARAQYADAMRAEPDPEAMAKARAAAQEAEGNEQRQRDWLNEHGALLRRAEEAARADLLTRLHAAADAGAADAERDLNAARAKAAEAIAEAVIQMTPTAEALKRYMGHMHHGRVKAAHAAVLTALK
jgi:hypothetical protein